MHYIEAKSILSSSNGMNLYRGCQHGCIYCDSRSRCYGMEHDFEDIAVIESAGQGRVHYTIGSALDIFGGRLSYDEVVRHSKMG